MGGSGRHATHADATHADAAHADAAYGARANANPIAVGQWVANADPVTVEIGVLSRTAARQGHARSRISRMLAGVRIFIAHALLVSAVFSERSVFSLWQQSWICTFEYPSMQCWALERTASMSTIDGCS